jgi:hypothetical protein
MRDLLDRPRGGAARAAAAAAQDAAP